MDRYRTTTALPYPHLSRATALLRLELGRQILRDVEPTSADWATLRVLGPVEVFDPTGLVNFEYRGSVERRRLAPRPNVSSSSVD